MNYPEFRKALTQGKTQMGFCVMYPAAGIAERCGQDWDWLWLDGQHGQMGYQDLLGLVRAADVVRKPSFVRVPWNEFGAIAQAADMLPQGIIVPCVSTVAEAQAAVRASKLPPLGNRSYGGRRPCDLLTRMYSNTANEELMLICQIETPEAIENAEAIAALPGVDGLFLGPDDIMLRRGYTMDAPKNQESLGKDMEAVMAACRKHGKAGVMVGVGTEMLTLCLKTGFQMIVGGGDVSCMGSTSAQWAKDARATIAGFKPAGKPAGATSPY